MHPGEQVLLRIIGQDRWQHPFHEHANHVRILGRDGNLILTPDGTALAGPATLHNHDNPRAGDGRNLLLHRQGPELGHVRAQPTSQDPNAKLPCTPDANGYNTANPTAINYFEWCQDHNKPMEAAPFGDVAGGGPVTLPDPNLFTNGAWYGGSPYLGPNATQRTGCSSARGPTRQRAATPARLLPQAPSRTRPVAKPASLSCGTRTTSARSLPTIFSRAE